jgi:hypothetical protein
MPCPHLWNKLHVSPLEAKLKQGILTKEYLTIDNDIGGSKIELSTSTIREKNYTMQTYI